MTNSNPINDPKNAKADEARIKDRPEPRDARELTPDEEKNVVGGLLAAAHRQGSDAQ